MAVGVVDPLEVVEVAEDDGHGAAALAAAGVDLVQALLEDAAHGDAGQRVLAGLAVEQAALDGDGHLRQQAVEQLDLPRIDEARIAPEADAAEHGAVRPGAQEALDDLPLGAAVEAGQEAGG